MTLVTVTELIRRVMNGCYNGQWFMDFSERETGRGRKDEIRSAGVS